MVQGMGICWTFGGQPQMPANEWLGESPIEYPMKKDRRRGGRALIHSVSSNALASPVDSGGQRGPSRGGPGVGAPLWKGTAVLGPLRGRQTAADRGVHPDGLPGVAATAPLAAPLWDKKGV